MVLLPFSDINNTIVVLSNSNHTKVTFIAVSDGIKIHIKILIAEKHQAQPRIEDVDWHNKQDSNDPTLLITAVIVVQMAKNLQHANQLKT